MKNKNIFFFSRKYAVEELSFLFRKYPFHEKIWLTKYPLNAHDFLQKMSLNGCSWTHVKVLSLLDWCKVLLAHKIDSLNLISYDQQVLIVGKIFEDIQKEKGFKNFSFMETSTKTAEYIVEWMSLSAQDDFFEKGSQEFYRDDLILIVSQYYEFLKKNSLTDCNLFCTFVKKIFSDSREKIRSEIIFYDSEEIFEQSMGDILTFFPKKSIDVLMGKFSAQKFSSCDHQRMHFSLSYNPWCEVHALIKFLVQKNIPWDSVEIVLPEMELYPMILKNICSQYQIPLNDEKGASLFETKWGRLFQHILKFFQEDFDQEIFLTFFRDKLIEIPNNLSQQKMKLLLLSINVGWSAKKWSFYLHEHSGKESEEEKFFFYFLKDLLKIGAYYHSTDIVVGDVNDFLITFFQKYAIQNFSKSEEQEEEETALFLEKIRDIKVDGIVFSRGEKYFLFLESFLKKKFFRQSLPRSGYLYVRSLFTPLYQARRCLVLLGLNDIWIPGDLPKNPFINENLWKNQKMSMDERKQRMDWIEMALDKHEGLIYWSCVKSIPMKQAYGLVPSHIMLSRYRFWKKKEDISYDSMSEDLYSYQSYEGASFYQKNFFPNNKKHAEIFKQREKVFKGRRKDYPTKYDAFFQEEKKMKIHLDRHRQSCFSVSSLERMARCPFLHYTKDFLSLKNRVFQKRDEMQWLPNVAFGTLIHEAFFEIMSFLSKKSKIQKDFLKEQSLIIARKVLKKYEKKYFFTNKGLFLKQVSLFERIILFFIDHELLRTGRWVEHLEWSFGKDSLKKENTSQDIFYRYFLNDNSFVHLSGSIDRIDRRKNKKGILLDYKTGASFFGKHDDCFLQGQRLQALLYSDIFKRITGKDIQLWGYFYATPRGLFKEKLFSTSSHKNDLSKVLSSLLEATVLGHFLIMKGRDSQTGICEYCDAKSSCSMYEKKEIDSKIFHKDIGINQPLFALQKYR